MIQLAGDSDAKLSLDAGYALIGRLPHPEFDKPAGQRPGPGWGGLEVRHRLMTRSWDAKFAPQVLALAAGFLSRKETSEVACGARLIEAVGTPKQAPDILAALDRALESGIRPRREPKRQHP